MKTKTQLKKDMEQFLKTKVSFFGIIESFNLNYCNAYRCIVETKDGTTYDVLIDNVTGEERVLCYEHAETCEDLNISTRQHVMEQFNLRLIRAQYNKVSWEYFSKKVSDVIKDPTDVFGYYNQMTKGI